VNKELVAWLETFRDAVQTRNFDLGLSLYSKQSVLFGTRVRLSTDMNSYLEVQWKPIWNSSVNFEFTEIVQFEESGDLVSCATTWRNNTTIDGQVVSRTGRATFVFRSFDGTLLAIHSHFSEDPK